MIWAFPPETCASLDSVGQAFRYNLFERIACASKRISTAIPNAKLFYLKFKYKQRGH